MALVRPPKDIDFDCEELTLLRGLYTTMAKRLEANDDNFDQMFEKFAETRAFYSRHRTKH